MSDGGGNDVGDVATLEEMLGRGMSDRDIAFSVWALVTDRSPRKTAAYLRDEYGLEVKEATISQWAGRHDWLGKQREMLSDIAPDQYTRAAWRMVGMLGDALDVVAGIMQGDDQYADEMGRYDKVRLDAAKTILDRNGFLPFTRKDAGGMGIAAATRDGTVLDAVAAMSDDTLEAMLAERMGKLDKGKT